jgi:maltooligosyltrehalose synthase
MLIVVPLRCVALTNGEQVLPVGEAVWHDTRLTLPDHLGDVTFWDIFTGQEIAAGPTIPVGDIFQQLPFALLTINH